MFVAPVCVSSEAGGACRKMDVGPGVCCQWHTGALHLALEISGVRGEAARYSGDVWA